ncbi:hypothetical protein [Dulcicalothrix desertica]|uniref:hypothetical protein n=1 Tax=Dulcicalothrix desertica TaxID=32056 RepID=UPI0011D06A19|nr:hypothetical protein [Dulcicalothrix desertica]
MHQKLLFGGASSYLSLCIHGANLPKMFNGNTLGYAKLLPNLQLSVAIFMSQIKMLWALLAN